MVIDSSVIVAIILLEDNWEQLVAAATGSPIIVAAPTLLETHMVLRSRLGDDADRALEAVMAGLHIEIVSFGLEHYREACRAFDRFGKGRHPASLNFGDCISYALSSISGQPLFYVGTDFPKTDVKSVVPIE